MIDPSKFFDADAHYRSGHIPWSFLAWPASITDGDGLPDDEEARWFLALMQARGVRLGTWTLPPEIGHPHTWAVVREEDRHAVFAALSALEAAGIIAPGYSDELARRLMGDSHSEQRP